MFCTKMSRYFHYIYFLNKKSTHCHLRVLTNFDLGVSGHFEHKKSHKTNLQNSQEFLNYIKSSCMIFSAKIIGYYQVMYFLQ